MSLLIQLCLSVFFKLNLLNSNFLLQKFTPQLCAAIGGCKHLPLSIGEQAGTEGVTVSSSGVKVSEEKWKEMKWKKGLIQQLERKHSGV